MTLISRWTCDDNAANTDVVDSVGSFTGTLTGAGNTSASSVAGKIETAINLNGSSAYINIPSNATYNSITNFTFMGWFYGTIGLNDYLFSKFSAADKRLYAYFTSGNGPLSIVVKDGTPSVDETVTSTTNFTSNTWYHFAFSSNGTSIKLHVNGVKEAETTCNYALSEQAGEALQIGGTSVWATFFEGRVDDFRLYDTELTTSDILAIYQEANISAFKPHIIWF